MNFKIHLSSSDVFVKPPCFMQLRPLYKLRAGEFEEYKNNVLFYVNIEVRN